MESTEPRKLPRMDMLLADPALTASGLPHPLLRRAVQEELDALRSGPGAVPDQDGLVQAILRRALNARTLTLSPVVNATGIVLHPWLGRSPMAAQAVKATEKAAGYCAVEFDLGSGRQGQRGGMVDALLCDLTGAEAAAVVNNTAAAVLLTLIALAGGKGVALSRGELMEADGGFRIPDIMEQSGSRLVEVGTVNRTRQTDYRAALEDGSAQFLMKVHTSGYWMEGFTQETSLSELVGLGRAYGFPVLYDLGAGLLLPARKLGIPDGVPSASEAVHAGVDLVCFSGDKLLGGPQAGIITGRAWAVEAVRKHPLFRALRPDKMTLAALESTLRLYREPEAARESIPVLSMLSVSQDELSRRADSLAGALKSLCGKSCAVKREKGFSDTGGGVLLRMKLPTVLVTLSPSGKSPEALAAALRLADPPVIPLLRGGKVILDTRTIQEGDELLIARALKAAL